MTLQDQLIFRRKSGHIWEGWNHQSRPAIGLAAFVTIIIGYAGSTLSMCQV